MTDRAPGFYLATGYIQEHIPWGWRWTSWREPDGYVVDLLAAGDASWCRAKASDPLVAAQIAIKRAREIEAKTAVAATAEWAAAVAR